MPALTPVTWLVHMYDVTRLCVWRDSLVCDMTHLYVQQVVLQHIHECRHWHLWRGLFVCVTWVSHICDMIYSYVWRDSLIFVTWFLPMSSKLFCSVHINAGTDTCDVTHSYVWRDSLICVTWLINMWNDLFMCTAIWLAAYTQIPALTPVTWLIPCVTWLDWWCFYYFLRNSLVALLEALFALIDVCDVTHWCVTHHIHMCSKLFGSIHTNAGTDTCNMTRSYVWRDSVICVTWRIHMCDTTHSYVQQVVLQHIQKCRRWHLWRDSFICVSWLIDVCDVTYWCVTDTSLSYVQQVVLQRIHEYRNWHLWHGPFICETRLNHMCDVTY